MRKRRLPGRVVSSAQADLVSRCSCPSWHDRRRGIESQPTMAAPAEGLLQTHSLHLLHEAILGEGAGSGAGLGALVAGIRAIVGFGIVEHIIVVDGIVSVSI